MIRQPSLREEKKLWNRGYKRVVCLDEAGRGPLAGPVVAAAVMINSEFKIRNFRDSKKILPKRRKEIYKAIINNPAVKWAIGKVSERMIDKINILEATKLAMGKAVKNLKSKIDFLIIDGNFPLDLNIPQKSIIKADEKVFSCALSSIIAKVYRDKIMERLHKKYPHYCFNKHKGYPTKLHFRLLKKYGPCRIHRKSFKPVIFSKNYKIKAKTIEKI